VVYRLWINDPAGSPNCPTNLPNGCYNTGAYDPARTPMCYDPVQFADFNALLAYSTARGEQLLQSDSAATAYALCSVQPVVTTAPAPTQPNPATPTGGTYPTSPTGTSAPPGSCTNCTPSGTSAPSGGNLPGGGGGIPGGSVGGRPSGPVVTLPAPQTTTAGATAIPWWLIIAAAVVLYLGSQK